MRVDRLKCWSSVHEGGQWRIRRIWEKKKRTLQCIVRIAEWLAVSHKYIAGTGGVAEKGWFRNNRLMQTKPLSFGFNTSMNTMKVGSRLYIQTSYIEVTYIGEIITVLLPFLWFSIPYRLNGFQIEGSPLDSQCWVLGSWASIWSSPGFFVLEKSPPNSRDSSIFFFQFCLQVCTEHSDPSVLSTFSWSALSMWHIFAPFVWLSALYIQPPYSSTLSSDDRYFIYQDKPITIQCLSHWNFTRNNPIQ